MGALTTTAKNLVLAWLFTTESTATVIRPTEWWVALHTEDPTETGDVGEVTTAEDADYVRKSLVFGAPDAGQTLSTAIVAWTVNSASVGFTVTHGSIWDAATGGNCLAKSALLVSRTMAADGVLPFNVGEIVATQE